MKVVTGSRTFGNTGISKVVIACLPKIASHGVVLSVVFVSFQPVNEDGIVVGKSVVAWYNKVTHKPISV